MESHGEGKAACIPEQERLGRSYWETLALLRAGQPFLSGLAFLSSTQRRPAPDTRARALGMRTDKVHQIFRSDF